MSNLLYTNFLTLLLTGLLFTACNQKGGEGESTMKQVTGSGLPDLKKSLKKYIDGRESFIAVSFQDTDQQFYLGINDTISLHAASTMKVPVMMEAFRQSETGRFSLDDSLTVRNEFRSIMDNSLYSLDIGEDSGDRLYSMIGSKESIRGLIKDMLTILLNQHLRKKLPAKLPVDVKVAHKTGRITKINHDSGIIFPQAYTPYILVVLTKGFEDHKEAEECIADISLMVYDWYTKN